VTLPLLSIVIPVRNEHESIARCLDGLDEALRGVSHEILVCYDSDDDSTLQAIDAMARRPPGLRLVQNRLGPSPSFAIRAGLSAARGDVVVVTMADLSDPPEAISRMADKIRSGADVVSGSRYMAGGHQVGGPALKTFLSRAAGLSLCAIAGVPTHDATTSFRAFSRRFLDEIKLESDTGFSFALEATVKAHRHGLVVDEVPVTWCERSAGTSNFRVARWLGAYLRWYAMAMAEPLLVWGLWIVLAWQATSLGLNAVGAPVICLALILASRSIRGRMTAFDAAIPAVWLAILLRGGPGGILGFVLVLAASALPLADAWRARRPRRRMAE